MTTRHKGKELGRRIQEAIKASGLTRAKAAEKAGMDQSSLARVCYGERSIEEEQLEALARALHVQLCDLTGIPTTAEPENGNSALATSAPGATLPPVRQGRGRAGFIAGHRDELSKLEVEFLSEVEIKVAGRIIEPSDDGAWWSLLDWFREEQRKSRSR